MSTVKEEEKKKDNEQLLGVFNQPIPIEDKTDPFDRQRCIQGWKQDIIEKQTCLVLGVGGIGCSVALTLARLGVGTIILIDYDKVDYSNLNRQILFNLDSVGKLKIDAAKENLEKYHVISKYTKIETYDIDVIKKWDTVLKLASKSNVIFNNIDYGGGFDIAVISLCMKLQIPYASGSSYCHSWIVEYFTGKSDIHSSFSFDNPDVNITKEIFNKLLPDKIDTYINLNWLPKDENPPTRLIGSSILCAATGGIMTVNSWIQGIIDHDEEEDHLMPNYTKMDVCHYWDADDLIAWPMPIKEKEEEQQQNQNKDDIKENKDKDNKVKEKQDADNMIGNLIQSFGD